MLVRGQRKSLKEVIPIRRQYPQTIGRYDNEIPVQQSGPR